MTPLEKAARAAHDTMSKQDVMAYLGGKFDATEIARAVLMAVREPDDALLQPGCAKHAPGQPMSERYPEECPTFIRRRRIWKEQIDHILRGGEAQPPNDGERG